MSQRSIIEINHDYYSHAIDVRSADKFVPLLMRALASGSDNSWEPLRHFGITRITQCHHSEDRKVVVGNGAITREYPFR